MRCTKCGREMRVGSEEYCKDANGNPMYKNFAYCDTCRIKSELQDMNYMHSNQRPKKKTNGCLTAILVTVLSLIMIGVIGHLLLPRNENDSKSKATPDVQASPDKSTTQPPKKDNSSSKPQKTETKKAETGHKKYISLNKYGKVSKKMSIKVNNAGKKASISCGNGYLAYKPGEDNSIYIVVNITVKNNSNNSKRIESSDFTLCSKGGENYVPTLIVGADDNFFSYDVINPKMKQSGNLAFTVPKNSKISNFYLMYENYDIFSEDIFFKLK